MRQIYMSPITRFSEHNQYSYNTAIEGLTLIFKYSNLESNSKKLKHAWTQ